MNNVWVKSPELPKKAGAYWCKLDDKLGSKNGAYFDGQKWHTYVNEFILEWLNEESEQPIIEDVGEDVEKAADTLYKHDGIFSSGIDYEIILELEERKKEFIRGAQWLKNKSNSIDAIGYLKSLYNEITDLERNKKEMDRPFIISIKEYLQSLK